MGFLTEISKIKAKLGSLEKELPNIAFNQIEKNKAKIIKAYLQDKQLSKGFNSLGERLSFNTSLGKTTGFYVDATVKKAKFDRPRKPKSLGKPYNFEWSGDTFDGMNIRKFGKTGYEIFTSDDKELDRIYGRIYDLNQENEKLVNYKFVNPEFDKKIMESITF